MATGGGETFSEVHNILKCSVCSRQNIAIETKGYCVDCNEYHCLPCLDMHRMFNVFERQNMFNDFNPQEHQGQLRPIPSKKCTKHTLMNMLDLYCEDHDVMICSSCVIDHSSCTNIQSVPDDMGKVYKHSILAQTAKRLKDSAQLVEDIREVKQLEMQKLIQCKQEAVNTVKAFKTEIILLLDSLENRSIEDINNRFRALESGLKMEIVETEKLLDKLRKCADELKNVEGNKVIELERARSVKNNIDEIDSAIENMTMHEDSKFTFKANRNITNFIKQMKSLGMLAVNPHPHITQITKSKPSLCQPKGRRQLNVLHQDDMARKCDISGMCLTQEGVLLVADCLNSRIKRLTFNPGTNVDTMQLQPCPSDICVVNPNEAAVGLQNPFSSSKTCSIQFFTLGDQMTPSRRIELNHSCFGLAYNEGKLYVSDGCSTVYTHDLSGNELQRTTTDIHGEAIFLKCRKLCVCIRTNRVLVADHAKGVVVLDTYRKFLSKLNDLKGCIKPTAVCTDGRNVFVAGSDSKCFVKIGHDGKKEVVFGDINHVSSMCFHPQENILIVSEAWQNTLKTINVDCPLQCAVRFK